MAKIVQAICNKIVLNVKTHLALYRSAGKVFMHIT